MSEAELELSDEDPDFCDIVFFELDDIVDHF